MRFLDVDVERLGGRTDSSGMAGVGATTESILEVATIGFSKETAGIRVDSGKGAGGAPIFTLWKVR
jgi:hypothetical protein